MTTDDRARLQRLAFLSARAAAAFRRDGKIDAADRADRRAADAAAALAEHDDAADLLAATSTATVRRPRQ